MKETSFTFQDSRGFHVSALLTEPPHPTRTAIVLCHGFLSSKQSKTNRRLTDLLVSRGVSTLAFDWFGMGESEGDFADITVRGCSNQLEHALGWLRTHEYHQLGIIGSSFGGYITLLAAPTQKDVLVIGLKCPAVDFPELLRTELGEMGMDKWKRTDFVPNLAGGPHPIHLRFAFYEDCCGYDAYSGAKGISAPTLIVQGDQDELIPPSQISRLHQALPGEKKLDWLPGADHHFSQPGDFQKMTDSLADWAMAHLPSSRVLKN